MGKTVFTVELHIHPPLSYDISRKPGGITLHPEIFEGEKLGDLVTRLIRQTPEILGRVYDSAKAEILPFVVTAVNGSIVNRDDALGKALANGDRINWFLTYTGG
jgi:sulfur carrier protein ThiS